MYKDKAGDYLSLNTENIAGEELGVWSYSEDRIINGGNFYGDVYGSKSNNETNSTPLKTITGNCSF